MTTAMDPNITPIPMAVQEPKRLLLVSCDEALINELTEPLEEAGYIVSHEKELELPLDGGMEDCDVDAWIVDGWLTATANSGRSYAQLPTELRALQIPLVVIIDPHSESEWRLLHESTADEFICKPLNVDELLLRLQVLFWRADSQPAPPHHVGSTTALAEYVHYVQGDLATRSHEKRTAVMTLAESREARNLLLEGLEVEAETLAEEVYRFLAMNLRRVDRLVRFDQTRALIYEPERNLLVAETSLSLLQKELEGQLGVSLVLGLAEFPTDGSNFTALLNWAEEMLATARCWPDDIMSRNRLKPGDQARTARRSILVLTSDSTTAAMVRAPIDILGYQSLIAADGHEAAKLIDENPPALVVLNHNSPDLPSLQVLQDLRGQCQDTALAPVLMLNFPESESDLLQGCKLGVRDYAVKPINPREFQARIERILTTRH